MKKRLLKKLMCPNFGTREFHVFGVEVERDGKMLSNIDHDQLKDMDDIKEGVVVDFKKSTAFPVSGYVLSMLCDEDVDLGHYRELFDRSDDIYPARYAKLINASLKRLAKVKTTEEGTWNREEMAYYDADVATPELRAAFLKQIETVPLWHIYLERGKHLVDKANFNKDSSVLEVGCGNSRSMAWLARPRDIGLEYVGIDISWKRMILARAVLPEGDLVQASALRLPFADGAFTHTVAFSSLHHLPDHKAGIVDSLRVLQNNGQMLVHEPIKKKPILPEGKFNRLRNFISEYEHSEHDSEIDVKMVHNLIKERDDLEMHHEHYNVSIVRKLLITWPMSRLPFKSSKAWWRVIISLDRVFVRLFCQNHNSFGPGAVFWVLGKSGKAGSQ